jgi:hypothetical protein
MDLLTFGILTNLETRIKLRTKQWQLALHGGRLLCFPENGTELISELSGITITDSISGINVIQPINYMKVSDINENTYKVVKIGEQFWMAENLKSTQFANGDEIPNGTGVGDVSGETDPQYWFAYDDDLNNVSSYGRLYTWYTVTDSRNVCPDGWHVPTDNEWTELTTYLDSESMMDDKPEKNRHKSPV